MVQFSACSGLTAPVLLYTELLYRVLDILYFARLSRCSFIGVHEAGCTEATKHGTTALGEALVVPVCMPFLVCCHVNKVAAIDAFKKHTAVASFSLQVQYPGLRPHAATLCVHAQMNSY